MSVYLKLNVREIGRQYELSQVVQQFATYQCVPCNGIALRIGAAQRELSRTNGELLLAHGYGCAPRAEWLRRHSTRVLPNGAHFRYKGDDGLWWLGKINASTTTKGVYLVRFLDDPGPIKLPLPPARYTTSTGAVRGSWCIQVNLAGAFARGVQRNVDESRGAAVDN